MEPVFVVLGDQSLWNTALFKRRKRYASKSRAGCVPCKIRRIKCDEIKPSCRKCTSTSRTCEYSARPCDSRSVPSHTSHPSTLIGHSAALPPGVRGGKVEYELCHFLRDMALRQASNEFDCDLWLRSVMQASQTYPAVWYAMVSLAACFRTYLLHPTENIEKMDGDTLMLHNRTIQELTTFNYTTLSPKEKAIVITTATIFGVICCAQGDAETAYVHIQSASQLYQQWFLGHVASLTALRFPVALDALAAVHARFDNHARIILGVSNITPPVVPLASSQGPFTSPQEAYIHMELLLNDMLAHVDRPDFLRADHVHNGWKNNPNTRTYHRAALAAWDTRWSNFCSRKDVGANRSFANSIVPLRIRRLLCEMILNRNPEEGEMDWDRFIPEFTQIVTLAGEAIQPVQDDRLQFFSAHHHRIALVLAAYRCRDPIVRQKALNFLSRLSVGEAVWDAQHGIGFARGIVELEEKRDRKARSCCMDRVCSAHRVSHIHIDFVGDMKDYAEVDWRNHDEDGNGMMMIVKAAVPRKLPSFDTWNFLGLQHTWKLVQ